MRPYEAAALHCERHGWHPKIAEVLDRLNAIGRALPDDDVRTLLVEEAQAEEVPGHLFGPVGPALEALRGVEADALASLM